jgi:uncharacterized membrane protein
MRAIQKRFGASSTSVVLSAVSAVFLVVVVLLPNLAPSLAGPQVVQAWHGRVTALLDPHRPAPSGAGGGFLPDARVLMLEGPAAGQEVDAYLQGPGGQQDSNAYRVGEDVVVTFTDSPSGPPFVAVADRWRLPQLLLLTALFVGAVVVVGGWRGARALLALALTVAIILKVLIPLLVNGVAPIPAAVVIATLLTILAIGLTEGATRASVAAILGTSGALAVTALLAAIATSVAGFTNTLGSELVSLQLPNGQGLDLRGMLLAAFMIGSVGVLDDVTVTQAAAVEELARHGLRGRRLYAGAFNVGRSHIAATVNTLFLAYAGASLPLLVFLVVGSQPTALLLNGEAISIEIVRTLVGSLGIVAAVPLTTVIAAWLAGTDEEPAGVAGDFVAAAGTGGSFAAGGTTGIAPRRATRPGPGVTLAGGLLAIGLVTAVAAAIVGPLTTTGPRTPIPPETFGSVPPVAAGSPAASGAVATPGASGASTASPGASGGDQIPIFSVGDAIPIVDDSAATSGEVTVLQVDPKASTSGYGIVLDVELRYRATQATPVDPTAWVARSSSGSESPADRTTTTADGAALQPGPLDAGRSRSGCLQFTLPDAPESLSLDFRRFGGTLFSVLVY